MITKKLFIKTSSITILVLCTTIGLHYFIKQKLKTTLSKLDKKEAIQIHYEALSVNIFTSEFKIKGFQLTLQNQDNFTHTKLALDEIIINSQNLWQFITSKKLVFENVTCNKYFLELVSYQLKQKSEKDNNNIPFIIIEKLNLNNGELVLKENKKEKTALKIPELSLTEIKTNQNIFKNKIPFTYRSINGVFNTISISLGKYEKLNIDTLSLDNDYCKIKDLRIYSKFNKILLSSKLNEERDHINLNIPKITATSLDFGYEKNRFFVSSDTIFIKKPTAYFYRDKLVSNNTSFKPMYSKLLRELNIDLKLEKIQLVDGYVSYEERIKRSVKPQKIFFSKLNATIDKINTKKKQQPQKIVTTIKSNAAIMGVAKTTLNWKFAIMDENDRFDISGTLKNFNANQLNPFLKSNLRSNVEGFINELYFTTSGNSKSAIGDMKISYKDFKFVAVKKDPLYIHKIATKLGNLFIHHGSKFDTNDYRHGKIEVDRDPTKSFFNYLWLQLRNGLLHTVTKNGKKNK